jgi:hypothetical protein
MSSPKPEKYKSSYRSSPKPEQYKSSYRSSPKPEKYRVVIGPAVLHISYFGQDL